MWNKITNIKPNINKIKGALFPENTIAIPKIHMAKMANMNLKYFLSLNIKIVKRIEKKEKFCMNPPAIHSSPKNPEL